MVFSSTTFLLAFLPCCLALYFAVPGRKAKNIVLLLFSLVFYAWGEPVYIALMLASIIINWFGGLAIEKAGTEGGSKKVRLVLTLVLDLAILGFFKYESFLSDNINSIFDAELVPDLELPLPIGISFFTLQAVSYIIDVYRKDVPAQANVLNFGLYISMFPQLVAGPIVRYSTIQDQILNRRENLKDFSSGLRLFAIGLSKKVLLANTVAILADKMLRIGGESIGFVGAWAGLAAFTFQIFFDFAGYSDMAIGLGKMFGFKYLRNFNYPYISKSVTEFWRRWHISLSTFFRDYIYIPLGGNRVSKLRWCFNLCVVWALTGFWHGAAWNYIGWGVFYGAILLLEKLWLGERLKRLPSALQHVYCVLVFMFGWLIFWIEDPLVFSSYLTALFGGYGMTGANTFWELTAWEYWPIFLACVVASTPIVPLIRARLICWARSSDFSFSEFMNKDLPGVKSISTDGLCEFEPLPSMGKRRIVVLAVGYCADVALVMLLLLSVLSVVSGSFNPFIYFRF